MRDRWFDEVTLEDVASRAGVTVRTVVRRFGGKAGLVAGLVKYITPQIRDQRTANPGDVDGAIDRVLALYEDIGDSVIRNLAQEPRHEALKPLVDRGRRAHRAITAETFESWLHRRGGAERRRAIDALVIAMDIYAWKLLRRDMGRSVKETKAVMRQLVEGVLERSRAPRPDRKS